MSDQAPYRLSRNAFGRIVFTEATVPFMKASSRYVRFPLLHRTVLSPSSTSMVTSWPGSNS